MPTIGRMRRTGEFPEKVRPAVASERDLMRNSPAAQAEEKGVRAPIDRGVARSVWETTRAETREPTRWLRGPFTPQELREEVGPLWIPARRFGVSQGAKGKEKVRKVDDCSEFMVNAAVEGVEKVDLGGIDEYVCLVKAWARAIGADGSVRIPLRGGGELTGKVHPEWGARGAKEVRGRTADLAHAYKQVAKKPAHRWTMIVTVANPETNVPEFFVSDTILFGETAA
eukprot:8309319-Heterocapsa_arctica.AAC.1